MRIRAGWSGALALGLVVVGGCAGGDSAGEGSGAASEPEAVEGSEASPEATPELSASELMSRIEAGDLLPSEALEMYVSELDEKDGELNAVVATSVEAARERAEEADDALADGDWWGPLHGLPITVKDTMDVAGLPTTVGSAQFADAVADTNAAAVQRLVDAGAIVIGKTNTPEFAGDWQTYNDLFGTTNNPWDTTRTPGGSSGGSAAAVAAGMTGLGLGGDLAGSLRVPAGFSGTYSHMPTFGLVPMDGHFSRYAVPPPPDPPGHLFGVVGPLARSAADLELALSVLAADDYEALPEPRAGDLADFRVAVWAEDPKLPTDAEVLDRIDAAVAGLEEAGASVEAVAPVEDLEALAAEYRQLRYVSTGRLELPPEEVEALVARRDAAVADFAALFEEYDVLLAPVAPVVAFEHDQGPLEERTLTVNGSPQPYLTIDWWPAVAQYAGLPVTTAPIGLSSSGLPVGLQVMGPNMEDRTPIAFAAALGEVVGGYRPPGSGQ